MVKRTAGFTLIELLLVVVLLAGSAVAVTMMLPNNQQDVVKEEAERMHHLVQLLGEDAVLNGIDYGIRIDPHRYQFLQLTGPEWEPIGQSRFFTDIELDEAIRLELEIGSQAWDDDDRLFNPGSLFNEDLFAEQTEPEKIKPPQVVVMASGEITPFTVEFEISGENQFWQVASDEIGSVWLLPPGETIESMQESR